MALRKETKLISNVLLRKLSRGSIIKDLPNGYGENQSVELLVKSHKNMIVKAYYCFEKVTFTDDILEEVGITEEWRIKKPGADEGMHIKFNDRIRRNMKKNKLVLTKKMSYVELTSKIRMKSTNKNLAWRNQGH